MSPTLDLRILGLKLKYQVFGLLYFYNSVSDAANSLNLPTLVSFVDFYNATLDNLDLMQEYAAWQDPTSAGG